MIKLHTDHYFQIGGAHLTSGKPCQDYAISGTLENIALAIVSDGCSTGRHTDVGSRVLALSTAAAIREHWNVNRNTRGRMVPEEVNLRQKMVLAGTRQALGLVTKDMLATCAYVYVSPMGGFVNMQGDGVVALKYRDGRIGMYRYEWEKNLPYYPAYNENGLPEFIKAHGDDLEALRLSQEKLERRTDGEFTSADITEYSLRKGIQGITIDISQEDLNSEIEFIAVFSDGVTQIENLDWKEAVSTFLSFKNTTGEFAKRRMIRGIKDSQKIGKGPFDDISYAVIRVEKNEEEEVQDE